eukprot:1167533-Ditylum_brightwellii.AAC.1
MDACPITSGKGTFLYVYHLTGVWLSSVSQKRIKKDHRNMKKSLDDAYGDNYPDTFAQAK